MSYTPINWQTGDTITAEKMNKMDNGWGVDFTQLFSETVVTEGYAGAELNYNSFIDADSLTVTFDGTDYVCPKIDMEGENAYGGFNDGPDFTTYPFFIYSASDGEGGGYNTLYTAGTGTYALSASAGNTQLFSETVTTTWDTAPKAVFSYTDAITADSITVIYDGTEYVCAKDGGFGVRYGDGDGSFSEYPFFIVSTPPFIGSNYMNVITTSTPGSHTVTVGEKTISTSSDFASAVNSVVETPEVITPLKCTSMVTRKSDMDDAKNNERLMYFTVAGNALRYYLITSYNNTNGTIIFTPANSSIAATIENDVFVVTSL